MPVGSSKGFTVWTKTNQIWQYHLLQFIIEREFVTAEEIYLESIKKNPDSNSRTPRGTWGQLQPNKHQIWNFLKHKCTWIVESDKKLYPECVGSRPTKSKTILWELAEDWPIKFGQYAQDKMIRADKLKEHGTVKYT
mgnify:CR=1 FL=1|tara:strand:+ start:565 stop:975 length:411 start_codon:yes stop_codon:yes gene_type:complete